jgi:hypothetical protein
MKNLNIQFVKEKSNFEIYSNPNINLQIIERELKRKRRNQSCNPNITLEYLMKYKDLNWDLCNVCINSKKISFNEMKELYLEGNIHNFTSFNEITLEFMHDITLKDLIYNMDLGYKWNLQLLSTSYNITFDEYKKYKNHPFIKYGEKYCEEEEIENQKFDMNKNPNISKKDILENKDYPWDFNILKKYNKKLSFEDYGELGFIDINNYFNTLNNKPHYMANFEFNYIEKYKNVNWFDEKMVVNMNTFSNQENYYHSATHSDLPRVMTSSSNVTIQQIKDNPQYKWNIEFIFANPNITFDYLKRNYEKMINIGFIDKNTYIDYFCINENLMSNPMTFQRVTWIMERLTRYYMHNKIYGELMIKTWHPKRFVDWCLCDDEKVKD